jgi:hypothetical protein
MNSMSSEEQQQPQISVSYIDDLTLCVGHLLIEVMKTEMFSSQASMLAADK